ncbi:DUF2059 domain-containing protein [Brevundimonas naejangsanensis]|uniref:DUF2059 domain-containing protein n=1 Tax=Brevundimonas naejangsanensis TaxID=588932 RepID=A0A494RLE8_9CAUL|nr:DUF2059 domain-containing protein [Brevundimonas naejangsanensis]AYG95460.1 DUF2059 domain-containing protein [Brevundimonas naejangsanensis]
MSRVVAAVFLSFAVAGFGASSVQAQARQDELLEVRVRDADRREALTQRYLELTTGGADKLIQQLVNQEIAALAGTMPAEQAAWLRNNAVAIMRPHLNQLIRSMGEEIQARFSEAELEALVRFYDTPQGRTIATKQVELGAGLGSTMATFEQAYLEDLLTKFCGTFDCEAMAQQATGAAKPSKR